MCPRSSIVQHIVEIEELREASIGVKKKLKVDLDRAERSREALRSNEFFEIEFVVASSVAITTIIKNLKQVRCDIAKYDNALKRLDIKLN